MPEPLHRLELFELHGSLEHVEPLGTRSVLGGRRAERDDLQRVHPWSGFSAVTLRLRFTQRPGRRPFRREYLDDVSPRDRRDEDHPLGQRVDVRNISRSEQGAVSLAERQRHQNLILGHTDLEEISRRQHRLVAMGVTLDRRPLNRRTFGENRCRRGRRLRLRWL